MESASPSLPGRMMALSALAFAICMPLAPSVVPLALVALTVSALWPGGGRRSMRALRPGSPLFWMFTLYLFHVAGLLWTTNMAFAGLDLGIKAPLLVFPLVHVFGRSLRDREKIQRWFVAANVVAVVICLIVAFFTLGTNLFGTNAKEGMAMSGFELSVSFFSSDFSLFLHPTYMAMYLTLALLLLLKPEVSETWGSRLTLAAGMLLLIGVVLCASKAGWLLLFMAGIGVLAERWSDRSMRRMVAWGLAAAFVSGAALYFGTEYVHERVGQVVQAFKEGMPNDQAANSTDDRLLVWRTAVELVRADPWLGAGTGDVKDEMLKAYADRGYTEPLRKKLNAHDQYLNTAVALGVGAALVLLLMIVLSTISAFRNGNILLVYFLLLNAFNWMVESMLEVQAGVLFFAFFAWLLTEERSRSSPLPQNQKIHGSPP